MPSPSASPSEARRSSFTAATDSSSLAFARNFWRAEPPLSAFSAADLTSLEETRALACAIAETAKPLRRLVLNAGTFYPTRRETPEGFEATFAVNALSPFWLTLELACRSVYPEQILAVASMAHAERPQTDDLDLKRAYDGYRAYALSKLYLIALTFELAERLAPFGVRVNAVHPGVIGTKLLRTYWGIGGAPVDAGAGNLLAVLEQVERQGITGGYFHERLPSRAHAAAYDLRLRKELLAHIERQTGGFPCPLPSPR
ncbi:SDR family NAD(P)-dependent oxidoreductase [Brockia lithotrophica]|uniref:Enoyl-ACP reductase-like protein n=1 Tax=Brockia lithotrophica TaxID=933949 RepID=A0A660KVZ1_9BACL|nr:SDR family NAD(P)-dependent oxidoreductase [Brockia lithotrophica]RKQ83612.1 enoyl-ACP reductase-like protein [Brockia lithotrophica]